MTSPRRSYRARLGVVPLDPGALALVRNASSPEELNIVDPNGSVSDPLEGCDMVLMVSTETGVVPVDQVEAVVEVARAQGMLIAAALTGNIATAGSVTEAEGRGLSVIREAVDMVVMVRDGALVLELLDVLRGGREGAAAAGMVVG